MNNDNEHKIGEEGFYHKISALSPLSVDHPNYGICPICGSNNTLSRELVPARGCLTCGHTEDFESIKEANVAWRPITQKTNVNHIDESNTDNDTDTNNITIEP